MIKSRKIESLLLNPTGNKLEYYLPTINEWLTQMELSKLSGCAVSYAGLKVRMLNRDNNPDFVTLVGCLYTPKKVGNGIKRPVKKVVKPPTKINDLWPVVNHGLKTT